MAMGVAPTEKSDIAAVRRMHLLLGDFARSRSKRDGASRRGIHEGPPRQSSSGDALCMCDPGAECRKATVEPLEVACMQMKAPECDVDRSSTRRRAGGDGYVGGRGCAIALWHVKWRVVAPGVVSGAVSLPQMPAQVWHPWRRGRPGYAGAVSMARFSGRPGGSPTDVVPRASDRVRMVLEATARLQLCIDDTTGMASCCVVPQNGIGDYPFAEPRRLRPSPRRTTNRSVSLHLQIRPRTSHLHGFQCGRPLLLRMSRQAASNATMRHYGTRFVRCERRTRIFTTAWPTTPPEITITAFCTQTARPPTHDVATVTMADPSANVPRHCCIAQPGSSYRKQWHYGIRLGKCTQRDEHCIGIVEGIIRTRDIKRLPKRERYQLDYVPPQSSRDTIAATRTRG